MKMMIRVNSTIIVALKAIAVMMRYGAISIMNRQHPLRPIIVGLIAPIKARLR